MQIQGNSKISASNVHLWKFTSIPILSHLFLSTLFESQMPASNKTTILRNKEESSVATVISFTSLAH